MLGSSLFPLQKQILQFVHARGKIYKKSLRGDPMEGGTGIRDK